MSVGGFGPVTFYLQKQALGGSGPCAVAGWRLPGLWLREVLKSAYFSFSLPSESYFQSYSSTWLAVWTEATVPLQVEIQWGDSRKEKAHQRFRWGKHQDLEFPSVFWEIGMGYGKEVSWFGATGDKIVSSSHLIIEVEMRQVWEELWC